MAAKLKLISKQIHWSLLVKAAIFALAWFFFPFWLFCLVALYLYFVPFFQTKRLFIPFFALLILAFVEPASFIFLLILAAIFYYLLLIKDLLLIDRRSAYELLVLALTFFLLRDFYGKFGGGLTPTALWCALFLAALLGILLYSFIRCFSEVPEKRGIERAGGWLTFVIFWQSIILGLFLPLDFIYQSVIIFIVSIALFDFIPEYCFDGVSRSKLLTTSMTIFALWAIVLASARWRI